LSPQDAEAWIARCARKLMALNPDSPRDATVWDDIAGDLLDSLPQVPPEWAAASFHMLYGAERLHAP